MANYWTIRTRQYGRNPEFRCGSLLRRN